MIGSKGDKSRRASIILRSEATCPGARDRVFLFGHFAKLAHKLGSLIPAQNLARDQLFRPAGLVMSLIDLSLVFFIVAVFLSASAASLSASAPCR